MSETTRGNAETPTPTREDPLKGYARTAETTMTKLRSPLDSSYSYVHENSMNMGLVHARSQRAYCEITAKTKYLQKQRRGWPA